MVKKWIIMISLLIVMIVGCIIETNYVNSSFKWLINSLETLQIEITEQKENIDDEKFVSLAYEIHDHWNQKVKILKCLIWHSGIKDVEIGLARIAVYVKENNYTEASAEIGALIDYLAHYLDDFVVSTENIF